MIFSCTRNVQLIVTDEFIRIWKESGVAYFKGFSRLLPEAITENHGNLIKDSLSQGRVLNQIGSRGTNSEWYDMHTFCTDLKLRGCNFFSSYKLVKT
jgi:hypothetical protein